MGGCTYGYVSVCLTCLSLATSISDRAIIFRAWLKITAVPKNWYSIYFSFYAHAGHKAVQTTQPWREYCRQFQHKKVKGKNTDTIAKVVNRSNHTHPWPALLTSLLALITLSVLFQCSRTSGKCWRLANFKGILWWPHKTCWHTKGGSSAHWKGKSVVY